MVVVHDAYAIDRMADLPLSRRLNKYDKGRSWVEQRTLHMTPHFGISFFFNVLVFS